MALESGGGRGGWDPRRVSRMDLFAVYFMRKDNSKKKRVK